MELSDLHIFRTVVREGGIVRAARRLHRVPSNITTRIQQLEASIGVQLFTRERHRLALSQSGERLLVYADRMLLLDQGRTVAHSTPDEVLREEILTSVFGWPVAVSRWRDGAPQLTPLRPGERVVP